MISLNEVEHREIRFLLEESINKKGKVLRKQVQTADKLLLAGDRLEPSPILLDIDEFDRISKFPALVLFWRAPENPIVHRRNPLLSEDLGTGLHTFGVDDCHTLHLGTFQDWIAHTI